MAITEVITEETAPELRPRQAIATRDSQTQIKNSINARNLTDTNVPKLKLLLCGYSFFLSGVNDGSLGPLLPYILTTFNISTGHVAIM
jgi:fucose permease